MTILFAISDSEIEAMTKLVSELLHGLRDDSDLLAARHLPGWMITRDLIGEYPEPGAPDTRAVEYGVWTPADRNPAVPWAVVPCPRRGDRDWLVAYLREVWVPEAIAVLEEEARADLVHEPPDRPSATESALDAATIEHAQRELERDRQYREAHDLGAAIEGVQGGDDEP